MWIRFPYSALTSVICPIGTTYPLDLIRSRLSIATASIPTMQASAVSSSSAAQPALASAYHTASTAARSTAQSLFTVKELTMWGMTLKVMREEGGVRALYRGLVATAMGVAPYVGKSAEHVGMPAQSLTIWPLLRQGSTSPRTRHSEGSSRLLGRPAPIESWHVARWRARYRKHSHIPSMSSGGRCK